MGPRFYRNGSRGEPTVALTFDDGPNPGRTDDVLDVLDRAGARATFFVVGKWVSAFPQTLERIVEAGHMIGNHSYAHRRGLCDFDQAETAIAAITGEPSSFVRAPFFDYTALARWPSASVSSVRVIDADVRTRDWSQTSPQSVVDRVLQHRRLAGGSIIVLHDGSESDDATERRSRPLPMIAALPAIIDGLRQRGLTPVGLDEMNLQDQVEWDESAGRS